MNVTKKLSKKIGMILLSIWLILTGLLGLIKIDIPYITPIMCILAIAAGVLILLDK